MKTLTVLQQNILEWAEQRNLLHAENAINQRLKLIEECGELAKAILENNINKQKDGIGDIFVVLVILSKQLNKKIYEIDNNLRDTKDNLFFIEAIIENSSLEKYSKFIMYFLNQLAKNLNLDITECANIAWNEIKDRTGKTVNGTFIKD